ncbi:MAG: xanthine dehydrogenase family protein molybdopterin-binding subunit [Clostridiales bacterium]|nr:xanthine dehydrogenase family protein molybdopterin-binding subunit [Clostridiales bacterium]
MAFHTVGSNKRKIDGAEKATGATVYTADMRFPNLLHIKVLRSPHAHARILSIDAGAALAMSGVVKIVTGADVPGPFGVAIHDQHPIARDKVRYVGEPVAAVVARTEREAEKAARAIVVDYEILPFVQDPLAAMDPSSPVIHENMMDYKTLPFVRRVGHNTYQHFKVRKGNAEQVMQQADCVVEGDYYFPPAVHVQMEPHCAVAKYGHDGSMIMYATTQAPFVVQTTISELLEIPYGRIQVIAPFLGGGFGGKSDITIEALVACVAKHVPGKFVRLLLSREEMFSGATHGRNIKAHYKLGFDRAGKLLAMIGQCVQASGGNADYAINVLTGTALSGSGPYIVPDLQLDVYGVYTNTQPIGAFRGYGHPEAHLSIERLMDEAARKLNMTPAELRMKNLLQAGEANGIGQVMHASNGNVRECARIITDKLWGQPLPKAKSHCLVGRGMAAYMKTPCMPSNAQSGALIKLNADGSLTLSVGAVDMGQGLHTALSQIAAEALDLPFERVLFKTSVDTFSSPYDWQTVASRSTWGSGNAVLLAAADFKRNLKTEAAKVFATTPDQVAYAKGAVSFNGQEIPLADFATGLRNLDGTAITRPFFGQGNFVAQGVQNPDLDTGQTNAAADWTFGCVGVELEVDTRTGETTVLRLMNAIDAGTIINPVLATEQVAGAMLMALGSATSETIIFDEKTGRVRNDTLVDYKIPGIEDIACQTEVFFVQTPEESGPYGAKGIGEHGCVGTVPAFLNALRDATGLDFHDLPASPDRIITTLKGGEPK